MFSFTTQINYKQKWMLKLVHAVEVTTLLIKHKIVWLPSMDPLKFGIIGEGKGGDKLFWDGVLTRNWGIPGFAWTLFSLFVMYVLWQNVLSIICMAYNEVRSMPKQKYLKQKFVTPFSPTAFSLLFWQDTGNIKMWTWYLNMIYST